MSDHLSESASQLAQDPRDHSSSATCPQATLQPDPEGLLIYHGATSIYRVGLGNGVCSSANQNPTQSLPMQATPALLSTSSQIAEYFGIDINDESIMTALVQFFKWQYPHFMFIYREAFLRDHFGDRMTQKYWSPVLLVSVAALGLLMSTDNHDRQLSEHIYIAAESVAIVSGLTRPSIVTVQTFLCLAFYEIGRGNLSKGWAHSGISTRP